MKPPPATTAVELLGEAIAIVCERIKASGRTSSVSAEITPTNDCAPSS